VLWTFINRAVDVLLLLLAVSLLGVLGITASQSNDSREFVQRIELFQEETAKVIYKNTEYMETRINALAESQDGYQNSTYTRLEMVENRVRVLEKKGLDSNKSVRSGVVVNNVQNNNIHK